MTPGAAPRASTPRTSPTAPTTSSASTTCATTWRGSPDELVQRGHNFAIVDEVDSILIDEARTPLIISGPADQATKWYVEFATHRQAAGRAARPSPARATTRSTRRSAPSASSSPASPRSRTCLGIDNLYESVNTPLIGYLNNAIKAKELFKHDKDYVVMNGEVLIVDEHTGRMLAGRRYNEGMHQAIEAKEGVEIQNENQTLATITLQNYFRMYDKLSGMTGTAQTEAAEFNSIYKLGVVADPDQPADDPRRPARPRLPHRGGQVRRRRRRHRRAARRRASRSSSAPSRSRRASTSPSSCSKRGVPHEVLNAKQHEREAAIVAQAGRKGAVTVATNMAGRGTDIMLGGNPEFMAVAALKQQRPRPGGDAGGVRGRLGRARSPDGREGRGRPSTTRSPSSAASTSWAPSGTSRAASTTSCAVAPAARATRASPGSTSRCRTT